MSNSSSTVPLEFEHLDVRIEDHIAVVTLNRPPVNAQNAAMRADVIRAFDMFTDLPDVRCVVLTGQGNVFSAGADIRERPTLSKTAGAYWQHNRTTREISNSIQECSKPVIAAINGPALGAGFGLVMACDIWVASDNATVAMPEIDVGLAGGTAALQRVFGKSRARRMIYTGMRVDAAELYRLGLIEACLPRDALMPYAMDIAREIASKSPIALSYAKEAARLTTLLPQRDGYRYEQNITVALSRTEDAAEAQLAFLEKRAPQFKGR
jgi:enoyl-CoA hydratase